MPSADQCSNLPARRSGSVAAEWRLGTDPADQVRRDLGNAAHAEQCHVAIGRTPSDRSVGAQLMNSTLVPLWTIFASACASQLVRWTQPCDWVLPMLSGLGVAWMA